jgi:hypothetical protein
MYYPLVPERVHALLPDVKLVAILRDPVKRAFSHYLHNRARNREFETFERALELERERGELSEADLLGNSELARQYRTFNYVERGLYHRQFQRWLEHFPAASLHVVFLEDLLMSPDDAFDSLFSHLGLQPFRIARLPHSNSGRIPGSRLDPALADELYERYAEADTALAGFLQRPAPWR